MGIDSESDVAADLQIGPTTLGMVRIYLSGEGFELPLDFHPDEAEEIAAELVSAAQRARRTSQGSGDGSAGGGARDGSHGGGAARADRAPSRPRPGGGRGSR